MRNRQNPSKPINRSTLVRARQGIPGRALSVKDRRSRNLTVFAAALLAVLVGTGGCRTMNPFQPPPNSAPVVFEAAPDQQRLIQVINANTAEVRQLSCEIQIRMDGVPPLSGTLIVEKPRRLRLKAGLIGISEMGVDVGSNDDEFWIWNKAAIGGQVPAIYFAKHSEFAQSSMRQMIPFEPQWIIDALGLMTLPNDVSIQGPFTRADGRYELRQEAQTAAGLVTKILVVDPKTGLVQQQSIYNAQLKLIAYANAIQHQYFEEYHASLPRRIEIVAIGPDHRPNAITVDLSGHKINQLYGDPALQWLMPQPSDAKRVDLAKMTSQPNQAP